MLDGATPDPPTPDPRTPDPPGRRSLELPERGVTLSLLDWGGDGPLLLLSHANGFCSALWDGVARELRSSYRVIGFDSRGHGDSTAPQDAGRYRWFEFRDDLIALAERLVPTEGGGERAYVAGHSFGGTVAFTAAAERPDLFARVAMLDPVLHPTVREQDRTPQRQKHLDEITARAHRRRHVWPSRDAVRESWRARPPFDSWEARSLDLYLEHGLRDREDGQVELKCTGLVEGAVYAHGGTLDAFEAAPRLRAPGLLMFATRGHFDPTNAQALARLAPDLSLLEVPLGHLMLMEDPGRIAQLLLEFGKTR